MRSSNTMAGDLGREKPTEPLGWKEVLLPMCRTLARTPESVLKSASVTCRLSDLDGEAQPLLRLSQRLAEEYGLVQVAQVEGRVLTIHLQRRDVASEDAREKR